MQRQIKFRIWDKKLNCYENWAETEKNFFEEILIHTKGLLVAGSSFLDENNFVVQQFTGLLDKNGKEIYEGDIVKTDPDHFVAELRARRESEEYTEYTKGQIRWVNEGFMVCQEYIGATRISEYSACDCCPCGLEIIGNIFENPELLS